MFTGIIEEVGTVRQIRKSIKGMHITVSAQKVLEDSKIGDSICTSGICLTITQRGPQYFEADVMAETIRRSKMQAFETGSPVNLERALRLDTRLGGHIVSGHIDGTGVITHIEKEDNAIWLSIRAPQEILRYVIQKGSIAIDGISLTVAAADPLGFKVSIIPYTGAETTLLTQKAGDLVNLECDVIGKYVEKLLGLPSPGNMKKDSLSMDFLRENGFF